MYKQIKNTLTVDNIVVLFSFKVISKKGHLFLLHYVFFAVQSESGIRFSQSNL